MSWKTAARMLADTAMTTVLPLLMAYSLVGEVAHEWLGLAMLLLFAAHHALNIRWMKGLRRGHDSRHRLFNAAIDLLLCVAFLFLAISSVMLSGYVFAFLPAMPGTAFARKAHMLASYWGFVLMSFHLGMHWNAIIGMGKRLFSKPKAAYSLRWILRLLVWLIAIYGIYAFVKRDVGAYLFYRNPFIVFDFDEALWRYLSDYIAVMILFASLGYYLDKRVHSGVPDKLAVKKDRR